VNKIKSRLSGIFDNKIYLSLSGILLFLLIWKIVLFILLPMSTVDGVWSLSHTFSMVRGDFYRSDFGHCHLKPYLLASFSSYLLYVYYSIVPLTPPSAYFYHIISIMVLAVLLGWLIIGAQKRPFLDFFSAAFLVFTNFYIYGMRGETVSLILIILALIVFEHYKKLWSLRAFIIIGFIIGLIAYNHPAHGFLAVLFIVFNSLWHRSYSKWSILFPLASLGFYLLLNIPAYRFGFGLYIEQLLKFAVDNTGNQLTLAFIIRMIVYNVMYNWHYFLIFLWSSWSELSTRRLSVVIVASFFIAVIALGRGYYLPLGLLFMSVNSDFSRLFKTKLKKAILVVILLLGLFWTHYLPTLQVVENPTYCRTYKNILDFIQRENLPIDNKVWFDGPIGLERLKEPNARLYLPFLISAFYNNDIDAHPGDVFYCITQSSLDFLKKLLGEGFIYDNTEIIASVPGTVSSRSLFRTRSEPLGLWKVEITGISP